MSIKLDGEQIKQIRKSLNLTQKQFADLIGAGLRSVIRWEKGEKSPSVKKMQTLGTLFNGIQDKKHLDIIIGFITEGIKKKNINSILEKILKVSGAIGAFASLGILGKYLYDYLNDDEN